MPVYCMKCRDCGYECDVVSPTHDFVHKCEKCGSQMRRHYSREQATNNFHPTVDLYANSLKQRKPRGDAEA